MPGYIFIRAADHYYMSEQRGFSNTLFCDLWGKLSFSKIESLEGVSGYFTNDQRLFLGSFGGFQLC
jgi:hypothetical protein